MHHRIYKSRLLTAIQDGDAWRVSLDEGYVTERHATSQAALEDAVRWIEGQEVPLKQRLARGLPDLTVKLYLYPTDAGGRRRPVGPGWGCPCINDKTAGEGWDGYPLLQSEMRPGERRDVGFVFMSGAEAAVALGQNDRFYLWEGGFIGEAEIVR